MRLALAPGESLFFFLPVGGFRAGDGGLASMLAATIGPKVE